MNDKQKKNVSEGESLWELNSGQLVDRKGKETLVPHSLQVFPDQIK